MAEIYRTKTMNQITEEDIGSVLKLPVGWRTSGTMAACPLLT